jgi:hypothetical protein
VIKETAVADLLRFDHLINYMYLPPIEVEDVEFAIPESVALLCAPSARAIESCEGRAGTSERRRAWRPRVADERAARVDSLLPL